MAISVKVVLFGSAFLIDLLAAPDERIVGFGSRPSDPQDCSETMALSLPDRIKLPLLPHLRPLMRSQFSEAPSASLPEDRVLIFERPFDWMAQEASGVIYYLLATPLSTIRRWLQEDIRVSE